VLLDLLTERSEHFAQEADLLSPVIAVQVSEFLARRRAARERRLQIFRALMVTRAERLSSEHVRALNSIDLEFTGLLVVGGSTGRT
jgi:hypothetical protein